MSAVSTQSRSENIRGRSRGGYRGRGRGRGNHRRNDGQRAPQAQAAAPSPANLIVQPEVVQATRKVQEPPTSAEEDNICFICAEAVKFYSLSECNHRTCHICALRLRALYKKTECTFCKHTQNVVIFTESASLHFEDYNTETAPFRDTKLSIIFETQEIMEETMILLRFNCPEDSCVFVAKGWNDLKVHVRAVHQKLMCDLCIRFKKVFAHEHTLYTSSQLAVHLPSLRNNKHGRNVGKDKGKEDGGPHPFCEFCRECQFGDDEMFVHMRERHEECFICKRQGIRHQYFENYDSLERHFYDAHYPCLKPECMAEKFVVFGSEMDFKAHMLERHGSEMSAKDIKEARRIEVHLGSIAQPRSSGGSRGRGRGGAPHEPSHHSSEPRPGPSRGGRRREGFGASLTTGENVAVEIQSGTATPAQNGRISPFSSAVDPEIARRHTEFMQRVFSVATPSAEAAVRSAIRTFRNSESTARDLISTFYNIVDRDLEKTASLISPLVDLLDDEEKKNELLGAFNGFKVEQREEFPDLIAGGQNAPFAGVASGRVINAKHSTQSRQSTGQIWDRVARAATSSSGSGHVAPAASGSRFPSLPSASQTVKAQQPAKVPAFRQPQRTTPWASSTSSSVTPPPTTNTAANRASRVNVSRKPAPALSSSAFPSLPPAAPRDPKPKMKGNSSLRNILGNTAPASNVWLEGEADGNGTESVDENADTAHEGSNQGQSKKKGKQKVTLFTLNSLA